MLSETNNLEKGDLVMVGLPFDQFSSFMQGPAKGPDKIREMLHCGAMNLCAESGFDLGTADHFKDLGNFENISHPKDIIPSIREIVSSEARLISLGGDHSLSYGTISGHQHIYPNMTVIQFDAHPDLHDEYDGNKYSHACPFARLLEQKVIKHLIQVGIRTLTPHQREQAGKYGVEIIEMKDLTSNYPGKIEGPVYISFDLDVLDPAFAPGISHHEPGGMSVRHAIEYINALDIQLVGADIMEYNPDRDINGVTGMVAAKLLKELAAKLSG